MSTSTALHVLWRGRRRARLLYLVRLAAILPTIVVVRLPIQLTSHFLTHRKASGATSLSLSLSLSDCPGKSSLISSGAKMNRLNVEPTRYRVEFTLD